MTRKLRAEIYDYLNDCGGYSDYNQKVEDVMNEFGLSYEAAEDIVWDWTLEF